MGNSDLASLLDLTWKLALVLGLAVLAMRALRWLSSPSQASASAIRILARLPLGPQQSVVLLAVGSKRLLIGHTPQHISLLTEFAVDDLASDPESPTDHVPWPPTPSILRDLFGSGDYVRRLTGRGPARPNPHSMAERILSERGVND